MARLVAPVLRPLLILLAYAALCGPATAALCLPWRGTAQRQINTFEDAWSHWNSGAGGTVPAGPTLYSNIRSLAGYTNYVNNDLPSSVQAKLRDVPRNQSSGQIYNSGERNWDLMTLGGFVVNIQYIGNWSATPWQNNRRTVSTTVTVQFAFNDRWDFSRNDNYNLWQNITREYLPSIIAGCGTPYRIYGTWQIQKSVAFVQIR